MDATTSVQDWDARITQLRSFAVQTQGNARTFGEFLEAVWNQAIPAMFPTAAERIRLAREPAYGELIQMRDRLRAKQPRRPKETPITITVRIPAPLHPILLREAADRRLSLNGWCVQQLMHG